jgi:uncharacterized OsmC-like protein
MEVTIDHLGATQFEVRARNHTVICDQPLSNGGFDEGMTPPEFVLAGLGACAAYYVVEYLKANHLPDHVRVHVTAEKAQSPARLAQFTVKIELPANVPERHRDGVLRSAKKCLIHNTLVHGADVQTTIASAPPRSIAA